MAPSASRAPELLSAQCGNAAPVTEVPAAAGEKTAARKTLPLGPTPAGDSMIRGKLLEKKL